MIKKHFKRITLLVLAIFVVSSGFSCKGISCTNKEELKPVTLEVWGVWDSSSQFFPLIKAYTQSHPTIKVNYKQFRYDEYERKLLEAWADDRGPDIFAVPVTWLKNYQKRLEPIPAQMTIPVQEMQGSIKQELITTLKTFPGLRARDINRTFVPVVYEDVIIDDQVYALPYYLDTLVTFYNEDLLRQNGISQPIADFHDLIEQTPKLSRATEDGRVYQSAVAMGGTENIPRFFDILASIMQQYELNVKGNYFDPMGSQGGKDKLKEVLGFYTDFASPGRVSYSWNKDMDNAFELFVQGRLAYLFGYSYHYDELKERNLQFKWDVTNFPQLRGAEGSKYYADYWVYGVSKKSANKDAAWNFVQTTATDQEIIKQYLTQNKKPTALRALIDEQLETEEIEIFASQVLTAENWYNGYDIVSAERYTAEIIEGLLYGDMTMESAVGLFVDRINQTYRKPNE
ncbi:carbohydrate ABC transporter substrate-binding protein [Candidatus Parcubacteria bacterium]|nr:MAG: carbohydrate ABC transporter substrate-binding protein [Candidatus Parcubacteria bacterium]